MINPLEKFKRKEMIEVVKEMDIKTIEMMINLKEIQDKKKGMKK
ncbi:hypothetical protein [Bacillus phage RadRaab]|uniref:Uncharacterized protein n=3 Tax=Claudivirus stitch TaxID=2843785 RepID=A0A3G8F2D0_9CAUD|nr:hypothetical protein [Bacillus thuringiensis]YP_009281724.1 hypothetical protein BIZ85_gp12 [Bacillus phage Stitch]ASU04175.1 hypothetical protein [Bacillus phage RadRaab]AZF88320.1 hypothetical protein StevenHerd11_12 [Bacillus phage StevenHerd11]UIS65849.1 hypothetical protein ADEMBY_13 [Bacillus phage Ademby]ANT41211.1 hypothetical protein STITCH_12 [Bacillus phage Stitch]